METRGARLYLLASIVAAAGCGGSEPTLPDAGVPDLVLEPASVDLGVIELGVPASARWSVRNTGSGAAQIQRVDVDASGQLAITGDGCTGSLAPGATCSVEAAVHPARAGELTAAITVVAATGELVGQVVATGQARVTVALAGDAGHVTSEPAGIDCGAGAAACSALFAVPAIVLHASDDVTIRWTAGCAGHGECRLELAGPVVVAATLFAPRVVRLDVSSVQSDLAYGLAIDPLDRRIVTGEVAGEVTGVAWTSALEPDGRIAWTDRFDPGAEGHDTGYAVDVEDDGSIVVVGQWYSSSWTRWNAFIRKLGPTGAFQWGHEAEEIGDDAYRGVAIDHATGAIYAVGFRPDPSVVLPALHVQGVIRRLDATGQLVWERLWQGSAEGDDAALDVAVAPSGDVLVAGRVTTALHGVEAWIAAYTPAGALAWSELRGDTGSDEATAVAVAPDGSFAVVGAQDGVAWIARYSATHAPLGELFTPEVASWQAAAFTSAGDLVVAGGEQTRAYTADLVPIWTQASRDLRATDVAVDHAGNVVVTGTVTDDIAVITYFQ